MRKMSYCFRHTFREKDHHKDCLVVTECHETVKLTDFDILTYPHYSDVIMSAIASQITSVSIIYSTVCSGVDQWKHQSSASLAFVRGIHRWPVNSPHKGPVTRKMFPFDDVIMAHIDAQCKQEWKGSFTEKLFFTAKISTLIKSEHTEYGKVTHSRCSARGFSQLIHKVLFSQGLIHTVCTPCIH